MLGTLGINQEKKYPKQLSRRTDLFVSPGPPPGDADATESAIQVDPGKKRQRRRVIEGSEGRFSRDLDFLAIMLL